MIPCASKFLPLRDFLSNCWRDKASLESSLNELVEEEISLRYVEYYLGHVVEYTQKTLLELITSDKGSDGQVLEEIDHFLGTRITPILHKKNSSL